MVHGSRGGLKPASTHLKSEAMIVADMAVATLPDTVVKWHDFVADYSKIRDAIEGVFPAFKDYNARIKKPGGFRLRNAASEREWLTASGKAQFLVFPGVYEDGAAEHKLTLTTIRSHDQYNTTIYGMNDRYRGITGRRDVVFFNEQDLASRGFAHGDVIDITLDAPSGVERVMRGVTAVVYDIPKGSVAAYYPEANVLVSLDQHDLKSGTPAYKSIPIRISAAA